ncbi:hypothetical protein GGR21_000037 [Dysgonomonas hofstadii]|uniref:Uncharacterized protein n=1 Tax=Dysgonomonas hofstadii TaxID=637886 RepID=A0A840CNJ6_9BACT|nr:hypothetical protein [Dysgonomonas hofstadii]MBB4034152.1 hypothetical protein [Dysgonomonas hofstadii]
MEVSKMYRELDMELHQVHLNTLRDKFYTGINFRNIAGDLVSVCKKFSTEININEKITLHTDEVSSCTDIHSKCRVIVQNISFHKITGELEFSYATEELPQILEHLYYTDKFIEANFISII